MHDLLKEAKTIENSLTTSFAYTGYASENKEKVLNLIAEGVRKCHPVGIMIAFKMGGMICHAKALLPHGMFGKWVLENLPMSHREANNLMILYEVCVELPTLLVLPMSVVFLIGSQSYPQELRQIIADNICGVYSLNKKEALVLKVGYQNGAINNESNFESILKKQKLADTFTICKLEGENLIKILEKKALHYQTLLKNQRHDTDSSFRNQYTTFMESAITVINNTISELSLLCNGDLFKDSDKNESLICHQPLPHASDSLDYDNIDDASLEKLMHRELCPDDIIADDDIPDHLFVYNSSDFQLCPDDIITNDDIPCHIYDNTIELGLNHDDFVLND